MSTERPLLLLFDGHALIHRAFHALPALSTKEGKPTGAVYGFASMLLKTLEEFKPSHWAIAFDTAAPTFRHIQFQDYKAHRPKAPDELISQFAVVRQLVQALGVLAFEVEGYEADDILGALSQQASAQGIYSIIVTGDTDTLQLVSPGVEVLLPRPRRPFSDTQLYDEAAVQQRYSLRPQQLADLKGLKGDQTDNIPGVAGIGEKIAVKLIQQFDSLEGIYRRIDEVTPLRIQEILRSNEEVARRSKELATIVTDVPVSLDLSSCRVSSYKRDTVTALFRELEFFSLLDKLPGTTSESGVWSLESGVPLPLTGDDGQDTRPSELSTFYEIVATSEALNELVEELSTAGALVVDTETSGKEARHTTLVGISLSMTPAKAWYIPVGHRQSAVSSQQSAVWGGEGPATINYQLSTSQLSLSEITTRLKPIMIDPAISKIAHNAKYDMTVLWQHGLELQHINFDTMIAAHLLGEKSLGLKQLTFGKLGIEMTPISALIGSGPKQGSMADVSIALAADYACADADMTGRLSQLLEAELKREGLWDLFVEVEMPLVPVLYRMERNGIALDTSLLRDMSQVMFMEMARIEGEIYESVGYKFNINSTQQLGRILFDELKLTPGRKTKSGYSTDISVLEGLRGEHPAIEHIIEYRQLAKLKSTYVDALPALIDPETGRVHTNFNQTVTATGRLSSSDPNLQNIPVRTEIGNRIRQAFVAPKGVWSRESGVWSRGARGTLDSQLSTLDSWLLSADYSQIELRVMAHLSQDPGLLAAFAHDEDIHAATASQVFGVETYEVTSEMRRIAKVVNFGVIYGMGDYGLEQTTGLSRQEATDFINTYFEKYRGVRDYVKSTKQHAVEKGYVQTVMGRRRYIPEINSSSYQVRQAAERMAINMPVQGTAADIIKLAMINIQNEIDIRSLKSKMILQVHDELLFEVPQAEIELMKRLVQEIMSAAMELSVSLKVETKLGQNWGEME
ncbi:MAG: DNA polymerase I [Dehalococcoidia bacterium]|nr:DNA polymerase I [Chloroflexota bacterium]